MIRNVLFAQVFILSLLTAVNAQQNGITNRPADVQAAFSNSKFYSGSYTDHAEARECGQTDPMRTGKKAFSFQYPRDLPPVVGTTNPRDKASGLATIASKGGDLILTVKAVNWLGEKLDLLVTCHPPKK